MSHQYPSTSSALSHLRGAQDVAANAAWTMQAAYPGLAPADAGFSGGLREIYGYSDAAGSSLMTGNGTREVDETNVYVTGLPPTMTMDQFRALLSPFGTVTSTRLLDGDYWQDRGVKGVGFARMATAGEASRAISGINLTRFPGAADILRARLAFKTSKDGAQAAPSEPLCDEAPEEMSSSTDPSYLLAMQWAAYVVARYNVGIEKSGAQVPGVASNGSAGLASSAPVMPVQANEAGDHQAWLAEMAYDYPYYGGNYYGPAGSAAAGRLDDYAQQTGYAGHPAGYAQHPGYSQGYNQQPGYSRQPDYARYPSTAEQAVSLATALPVSPNSRNVARSQAAADADAGANPCEGQCQRRRISPPPCDDGRKKLKLEDPRCERSARSTSCERSSRPACGCDQCDFEPPQVSLSSSPSSSLSDERVMAEIIAKKVMKNMPANAVSCPLCTSKGVTSALKWVFIAPEIKIPMCFNVAAECPYPFTRRVMARLRLRDTPVRRPSDATKDPIEKKCEEQVKKARNAPIAKGASRSPSPSKVHAPSIQLQKTPIHASSKDGEGEKSSKKSQAGPKKGKRPRTVQKKNKIKKMAPQVFEKFKKWKASLDWSASDDSLIEC